jgi:uncharacterized protein YcbX
MQSNEVLGTVAALWRFPVKSMLGEQLHTVQLGAGGIVGDRAFAVRDGRTLTIGDTAQLSVALPDPRYPR